MNRKHVTEARITAYTNKICSVKEALDIRNHLNRCPQCRKKAEDARQFESMLDELPLYSPSDRFTDRVMKHLSVHQESPKKTAYSKLWGADFFNVVVAGTATYVFVISGVLSNIVRLHQNRLGLGIEEIVIAVAQKMSEWMM